jgi:Tol biopolymer transport system component
MTRLLLVLSVCGVLAGCACGERRCNSIADCQTGERCLSGVCGLPPGADGGDDAGLDADAGGVVDAGPQVLSLELRPATTTLASSNGSTPTQVFTAWLHRSDGTVVQTTDATWAVDALAIGVIDPGAGVFTASGRVGGTAQVTASVGPDGGTVSATARVTVTLAFDLVGAGVPAGALTTLGTAAPVTDPSREPGLLYPLDGVFFPQNVAPPDVQWARGTPGDVFEVVMQKPSVTVKAYVVEDGNHHWLADADAWRAIAQSDPGQPASLSVQRYEAASQQVISGVGQAMKFARGSIAGSIYYWDIVRGRIVRIDDGTTTRTEFMPTPPVAADGVTQCVGCHVVGPSGRYMAGRLGGGDNIGALFDLTTDLTGNPPPTRWPTSPTSGRWWFASFSPDETRLVVSQNEGSPVNAMNFLDSATGEPVAVLNVPAGKATHVAWSPDGARIAYTANLAGWGGDSTTGDIAVVPVVALDTLGTASVIHTGASLTDATGGAADSYPTWSPDSAWLAFAHGSNNRSETGLDQLYLMRPDGTQVTRLSRAIGGDAATLAYQPRFSPFMVDGYYWLTYLSRRDYGNAQVGTQGSSRQQVWVAAVKINADAGVDPSEVGYWLPGQDTQSKNIAAYWAPRACRQQGQTCAVGSECCSGDCRDGDGGLVCSPALPSRCRHEGESCSGAADCCAGQSLACHGNVCSVDIQ